jgi:hypothetical protein
MVFTYILSFFMYFPLTVYFNNILEGGMIFMGTFSEIMVGPLFWLALVITCAVIIIPYYAVYAWWWVFMYDEFNVDQNMKLK